MRRTPLFPTALVIATILPCIGAGLQFATTFPSHAQAPRVESPWDNSSVDVGKLYDRVVDTIERSFFDVARLKEVDWRARAAEVRPSVLAAPTLKDAVRIINGLLAELKTSHTALLTPDEYFYYILLDVVGVDRDASGLMTKFWGGGPYFAGTGAFTREIDGRHFVDAVLEGSPADRAGLKYGDELVLVDDAPYSPIAALRGKVGKTVELTIRRHAAADLQRLGVPVVPIRPVKAFAEATQASARIIERGGARIGYVHVWASAESASFEAAVRSFTPNSVIQQRMLQAGVKVGSSNRADVIKAIGEWPRPIDSLIVDFRGRVGGNMSVAAKFLETLDAGRRNYWGDARFFGRSARETDRQQNPYFHGRSVALIDRNTRSAGEIAAYGFKRSGFGPLIGTPTAGAVSSGAVHVMPGDLLLYVAVSGLEFDGQRLEGAGVAPDYLVQQPLPYAAGADPVLDAAIELLAKRVAE